jgi:hypothetical protein
VADTKRTTLIAPVLLIGRQGLRNQSAP